LRRAFSRHLAAGGVYGPELRRRLRLDPEWLVWLKFPQDPQKPLPPLPAAYPWFGAIIQRLDDGWVIDVDPEEL
jgi:hypothetical protein